MEVNIGNSLVQMAQGSAASRVEAAHESRLNQPRPEDQREPRTIEKAESNNKVDIRA